MLIDYMSDDYYIRFGTKFRVSHLNSSLLQNFSQDSDHEWPGKGSYVNLLFLTESGLGWVGNCAVPTGWLLFLVLTIMVIFALPIVRRKGLFQVYEYLRFFIFRGNISDRIYLISIAFLYNTLALHCILHTANYTR
jgi:hypothetical protein